jgi:hypothetical protein
LSSPRWTDAAAPWWLLDPYRVGSALGLGWSIASLSDIANGAAILELAHPSGDRARIHLCGHDGAPRGLASSAVVDFIVMDGRTGREATDESIGRVILSLARHVRQVEASAGMDWRALSYLMPHGDRVERFGPENLR